MLLSAAVTPPVGARDELIALTGGAGRRIPKLRAAKPTAPTSQEP